MEYFNQITSEYLNGLNCSHNSYKLKLELLGDYENVIDEITRDLSLSAQGRININYQQLIRRSCSLTLINVGNKYAPNQNGWFWYRRKFKLWLGLSYGNDIFWFSQGIYFTQRATGDSHVINIEGIDKGGALDGTLKLNMLDYQYIIEPHANIAQLIKDTLWLNVGKHPIDTTPPIIDRTFGKMTTETEISVNEGEYVGNLFTNIADSYGADIYYDNEGRLTLSFLHDGNKADGYAYLPSQYDFTDENSHYSASTLEYGFEGVNAVTVYTNISAEDKDGNSIDNVSYTAYNNNPLSPLRVDAVDVRRMDSVEIPYVNVSADKMKQMCKQYADYLLLKNALVDLSISFNASIIPHLDVNKVITVTDKAKGLNRERFVVQSITFPLSAGEMTIEATNVQWLPSDTDIER